VLGVLVPGFGAGDGAEDRVVVSNDGGEAGVVAWGADLVGIRVLW